MSKTILVTFSTVYGSTQEVAEQIAATLRGGGLAVDLQPSRQVRSLDPYCGVVLGAPLYMFHWHKDALGFISKHRMALSQKPLAIFALGPLHAEEKEFQDARAVLDKELAKYPWLTPVAVEMIGGKMEPAKFRFPHNLIPALRNMPASDIRDWTAIRTWAGSLAASLLAV
jgi:menaquinone-dependent protoporphyrinogen oxidase